jgi:hypothetical protein
VEQSATPGGYSAEVSVVLHRGIGINLTHVNRATKRLATLAHKFTETVNREMGVSVFMLVKYRNPQGLIDYSK